METPINSNSSWTNEKVALQVQNFVNDSFSWAVLEKQKSPLDSMAKAAVLVPLFIKEGEIFVWLTLRSKHLSKDPGDVAFPGGKRDHNEDEAGTCLREAEEEIGLSRGQVQIIGQVPPRISRHRLFVSPVIGLVNPTFEPQINAAEVEVAFSLPLKRFLSKDGFHHMDFSRDGRNITVPFFDDLINGRIITTWGLTAVICVDIATGMFEQFPEFPLEDEFKKERSNAKNPFEYQTKYLEAFKDKLRKSNL